MSISRCVNLDWLELYCLEDDIGFPHDANFFRRAGFHVEEREYGTPMYNEMFTLYDHFDEPLIEIRRDPKSAETRQINGLFDPRSCHVRLSNRTCYFANPVQLLQQFIEQYGLHYQRISRVDICYDFTTFDYGDNPADFMRRYMKNRYTKINQANISAHGTDAWGGRTWNSVSWGSKKSMVGTKFYNKKLELSEARDKPYIRQAWRAAGLVDDEYLLTKDGNPVDIWRVEFSVKSGTRNWFIMENEQGKKKRIQSVRNTLEVYDSKKKLWQMFLSLADHYFHFKKFEEGKRKDLCEDKKLFNPDGISQYYKLENVASTHQPSTAWHQLYMKLLAYREECYKPEIYKAISILLEDIEFKQRTNDLTLPWNATEVTAIRLLMAKRMKSHDNPLSVDKETIEAMLQVENGLFGESVRNAKKAQQ